MQQERPFRAWSRITRRVIGTPYPYSSGHVATGPEDTSIVPDVLHPAFHGALDWHSCVHMQWSLATLLGRYADHLGEEECAAARELLAARLTAEHLAVEVAYLRERPAFERPYGWAWAAMLCARLRADAEAALAAGRPGDWPVPAAAATAPLADLLAERVLEHLPRQAYPVRHGKHQNDAFALLLLIEAYGEEGLGREDVVRACRERALDWFGADGPLPTDQEPGGSDFLSPALTEALLMTRVVEPGAVAGRLEALLPGLGTDDDPGAQLLLPPTVLDPEDGQGAHLLGLALSRAWALRGLARWVTEDVADRLERAATEQEDAVLRHITDGHFMATHWLVSFALLAGERSLTGSHRRVGP